MIQVSANMKDRSNTHSRAASPLCVKPAAAPTTGACERWKPACGCQERLDAWVMEGRFSTLQRGLVTVQGEQRWHQNATCCSSHQTLLKLSHCDHCQTLRLKAYTLTSNTTTPTLTVDCSNIAAMTCLPPCCSTSGPQTGKHCRADGPLQRRRPPYPKVAVADLAQIANAQSTAAEAILSHSFCSRTCIRPGSRTRFSRGLACSVKVDVDT